MTWNAATTRDGRLVGECAEDVAGSVSSEDAGASKDEDMRNNKRENGGGRVRWGTLVVGWSLVLVGALVHE